MVFLSDVDGDRPVGGPGRHRARRGGGRRDGGGRGRPGGRGGGGRGGGEQRNGGIEEALDEAPGPGQPSPHVAGRLRPGDHGVEHGQAQGTDEEAAVGLHPANPSFWASGPLVVCSTIQSPIRARAMAFISGWGTRG